MITRPTVLVLGAGASLPSGYPLGEGLVRGIVEGTKPKQQLYQVLIQDLRLAQIVRDFNTRLAESERRVQSTIF